MHILYTFMLRCLVGQCRWAMRGVTVLEWKQLRVDLDRDMRQIQTKRKTCKWETNAYADRQTYRQSWGRVQYS